MMYLRSLNEVISRQSERTGKAAGKETNTPQPHSDDKSRLSSTAGKMLRWAEKWVQPSMRRDGPAHTPKLWVPNCCPYFKVLSTDLGVSAKNLKFKIQNRFFYCSLTSKQKICINRTVWVCVCVCVCTDACGEDSWHWGVCVCVCKRARVSFCMCLGDVC